MMTIALPRLNYHHLHYFWAVAKEGHLSRAAERLRIAPSALSTQIRQLEHQLGQPLFHRQGRSLVLTEAGRIALQYADTIMATGQELVATLKDGRPRELQVLRLGAVATLSRNFQLAFVAPLVGKPGVELVVQSGSLAELLPRLQAHTVDLVLSNRRVPDDAENALRTVRIARQQVSLVGPPRRSRRPFRFPGDLAGVPVILPSRDNGFRSAFDLICEQANLRLNVVAEVDDMAMLRLLARESGAMALVPAVVVRDELHDRRLQEYCTVPNLFEEFWAVAVRRQYQHPLLRSLLERPAAAMLAMDD
jgi:LysR family transcriptional activator of nhaA